MKISSQDDVPILKVEDLEHCFGEEDNRVHALRGVSFEARAGEVTAIVGPSGCGKSSLLHILGLLDRPDEGTYRLLGQDVSSMDEEALANLRKRHIGFIFQNFSLIEELTVQENIELALLYRDISRKERKQKVAAVMDDVGIAHRAHHTPMQLSGGQQQRVAIVRSLINSPELLLVDEPTSALDPTNKDAFLKLLFDVLDDTGCALVFVSHDTVIAERFEQRVELSNLLS